MSWPALLLPDSTNSWNHPCQRLPILLCLVPLYITSCSAEELLTAIAAQSMHPPLQVLAKVLGAEAAIGRIQFVSGTHAIATALYSVLRPGDELLAVAGRHVRISPHTLCVHATRIVAWNLMGPSSSICLFCIVHPALLVLYMHDRSRLLTTTQLRHWGPSASCDCTIPFQCKL